jgi:hypothetical protein
MSDASALLYFNGVNGATGEYDLPPTPVEVIAGVASGQSFDKQALEELRRRRQRDTEAQFAVKEGVDPKKLDEAGWGVIFAFGADAAIPQAAIYEALAPLLQLRKAQASARNEKLYREFRDADAYRPGESKLDFLNRQGVGPGPVDPEAMPYYLLIVGDPDTIPFRFQYQLDVQYAVGRIHFETVAEYAAYARSVVAAETGSLALAKRAAFFAAANDGDMATKLSRDELAAPLAAWAADPAQSARGWAVESYFDGAATKARLASLLGDDAPAFLFTASHGMCYANGDVRQLAKQGALLCQDWPGPSFKGALPDGFFYSGDDLASDAKIFGTIAMHFACFGAGTPMRSDYTASGQPDAIAPQSFLGRLPQRMLAHPRGGALAVIGHVERAWGCSFHWDRAGSQTEVFKSTIKRLMEGHPVGSAVEYFNGRYAELSSDLSIQLEDAKFGAKVDPYLLAGLWTANNDARGYSVVGDPAVRLQLAKDSQPAERPALEVISEVISVADPQTAVPAATAPAASQVLVDYGVFDSVKGAATSLQDAAKKIGEWLAETFETVTSVHVSTYVSDDLSKAKYENGVFSGATLRAVTIANLDGNTLLCVPENNGAVDEALWKIHSDVFDKALANRIELLKTAAATAASLVPGLKGL